MKPNQGIVLFLYDTLGIKCEVIMGVAQYCVSKGKSSIRYIQKTVMNLTDEGIHTYEELEAYLLDRKQKDDYRGMVKRVIGASVPLPSPNAATSTVGKSAVFPKIWLRCRMKKQSPRSASRKLPIWPKFWTDGWKRISKRPKKWKPISKIRKTAC